MHGAGATPGVLLGALGKRTDLSGVRLYHLHTMGEMPSADPASEGHVRSISLFTGANMRKAIEEGRADCNPAGVDIERGHWTRGRFAPRIGYRLKRLRRLVPPPTPSLPSFRPLSFLSAKPPLRLLQPQACLPPAAPGIAMG